VSPTFSSASFEVGDQSDAAPKLIVTREETISKPASQEKRDSFKESLVKFWKGNWLVLGEVLVIYLAYRNPKFFATGGVLRPEFYISKLGVFTIFFINGIALSIEPSPDELQSASKTNALIQLFNFGFIPLAAKLLAPMYPIPAFRCVARASL
jgi:hypothetical protein